MEPSTLLRRKTTTYLIDKSIDCRPAKFLVQCFENQKKKITKNYFYRYINVIIEPNANFIIFFFPTINKSSL